MIRSKQDAYKFAEALDQDVAEGSSRNINLIQIRKENGYIYAVGQNHQCGHEQKYTPAEFADFVIFPERKRINDWITTQKWMALTKWPSVPEIITYE